MSRGKETGGDCGHTWARRGSRQGYEPPLASGSHCSNVRTLCSSRTPPLALKIRGVRAQL